MADLVTAKAWWQSRTLWVNLLGGVAVVLEYAVDIGLEYSWIAAGLAAANFVLRFLTGKPVAASSGTRKLVQ